MIIRKGITLAYRREEARRFYKRVVVAFGVATAICVAMAIVQGVVK